MLRSRAIREVRHYLEEADFIEVETPILQPIYGGASAKPFTSHHNSLDQDYFLRIAPELYLKRCIIGGLEKVYELGKDFRNEGLSTRHNPEFTMLEWYEAYADYHTTLKRCEEYRFFSTMATGKIS
jgi:lysyl-tRNA synthetase class 2